MEEIKDVVKRIVDGCAQGGENVSDIMAAFIARTVSPVPSVLFTHLYSALY